MQAQTDSTVLLQQIEVTAERIELTDIGKHTDQIDTTYISHRHASNLASLLTMNTPLFVRSYGAGTLATVGIRGGNASHTQIIWNGIPIRNPMIGLIDLALLPSAFIDQAAVHYGGHGAAFGSGAVGGLISLSNNPVSLSDQLSFQFVGGSWGRRDGHVRIDYGLKKIRFSSRFFSQSADNNYRYRINKDLPEKNQVHHHLLSQGILQEISWRPADNQSLTARIWFQYADREIPPTSTQNASQAAQQDEHLRASIQYHYHGHKFHWQIKTAWLDENIDYQDTLILLFTENRFKTWLTELETSFGINKNILVTGGINTEISSAESANYLAGTKRGQSALFSSASLYAGDWLWRIQMREEVSDGVWSPLLVDFAAEWKFLRNLTFKSSVSRNYRIPTLNDLHWRPGGNPSLLPEKGWTIEGGVSWSSRVRATQWSSSLTAYSRHIDQWIMWMPPVKDVSLFWSPINIAQVYSRGIEFRQNAKWIKDQWKLDLKTGLDFTWSTFETPLEKFNIEKGDQLFYTPVENVFGGLTLTYGQFTGWYNHNFFGSSIGINDPLDAANIGSGGLSVDIGKGLVKCTIFAQIENLWNVPYRIIERRPMPGRTISIGARFAFSPG